MLKKITNFFSPDQLNGLSISETPLKELTQQAKVAKLEQQILDIKKKESGDGRLSPFDRKQIEAIRRIIKVLTLGIEREKTLTS